MTKICSVCGIEKDLLEFNKQKLGKFGRRASCRECQKRDAAEYRKSENGREKRRTWKKTPKGRECQKRYRDNPVTKEKNRLYARTEEYRERHRQSVDRQRFGGNRQLALERDGYKCTACGSDYILQVHHKDESGRNKPIEHRDDSLDNLITLCVRCHIKEHNPVLKRWGIAQQP